MASDPDVCGPQSEAIIDSNFWTFEVTGFTAGTSFFFYDFDRYLRQLLTLFVCIRTYQELDTFSYTIHEISFSHLNI